MRYNEQLPIKLYDKTFTLQAIIDDYAEISFSHNLYEAGDFSISINYNIPNAQLFQRGMFIQFGNDEYMFGEILSITDTIAQDGKGSQTRTITGKDARFLFKRRVIKNMNSEGSWVMTAKGELCMRNLIADQCGVNAEEKRRLPIINNIPSEADALGASYSVSESFSNLYDTLVTIATQSEIGWRVRFTGDLILEVYNGTDLSNNVQFSTDFDSLSNGTFTDTSESFANTVYVGGKGTGEDRDVYEGEIEGAEGLDRYEAFDNQSGMTTESEYETEALSILSQYGQTITVNGNGLAKCPYIFKEQYNIGDIITIAFSGKSAKAQILGVTEHWSFGTYGITFSFGKPVNDLNRQLQLILKQIQKASNKTTTTSSVKYYTIPTDTQMPKSDVIYDTIGFTGTVGTGATFKLYLDNEKTGAKTYHVYFKQLGGTGKLTLTTGVTGASNLVMNAGTYVAIIYVDAQGNVTMAGATATSIVEAGNSQPVTSDGVNSAISGAVSGLVTGVKGNSEADYRTGNVNITAGDIGAATASDITDAINALDVASVGGSGKYIESISESNGKISATVGDISGTVTSGDNAPVSGGAVADILSNLPTDAVLHYSFDEVPDYPDGTALYTKDKDFTSLDRWTPSTDTILTLENGTLKLQSDGTRNIVLITKSILTSENLRNKIVRVKIKSDFNIVSVSLNVQSGTYPAYGLKLISKKANEYIWAENMPSSMLSGSSYLVIQFSTKSENNYCNLEQIYIGDGSYSTPIIDNANGQNNATNNGGIAVKGVSGKGAYFLNGKYANCGVLNLSPNFSISMWVKPDNNTTGLEGMLFRSNQIIIRNGTTGENFLMVILNGENGALLNRQNVGQLLTPNSWTNIIFVRNGTSFSVFYNGSKMYQTVLADSTISNNNADVLLSQGNTTRPQVIDDLLIFDRALTEKEVLALYYNKANTPKYFSKADYLLEQIANNS